MDSQPPRPPLSRAQLRELDRLAADRYGLPTLVLMENAGRGAVDWARAESPGRDHGPGALWVGQ